jgi:hypothetical protein
MRERSVELVLGIGICSATALGYQGDTGTPGGLTSPIMFG